MTRPNAVWRSGEATPPQSGLAEDYSTAYVLQDLNRDSPGLFTMRRGEMGRDKTGLTGVSGRTRTGGRRGSGVRRPRRTVRARGLLRLTAGLGMLVGTSGLITVASSAALSSVTETPASVGTIYVANGAVDPPHGNTVTSYPLPSPGSSPSSTLGDTTGSWALNNISNIAFDAQGDMWVSNPNAETVVEYTASQLASSGSPAPHVTLALSGSVPAPALLAFDAHGDLWVSNRVAAATEVEFTPSQLATSGSPTPAVTISVNINVYALGFDSSGDLWMVETGPDLVEFTASQLTSSGNPAPAVTISGLNPSSLSSLAFNSAGDLWVTSGGSVAEYTPSQLAASGSPTPNITMSVTVGQSAFSFDGSGDLWISGSNDNVVEYTSSQLAAGGSPTPNVTLDTSGAAFYLAIAPSGDLWVGG